MEIEAANRNVVALLGRKDAPTDGVEDYCIFLGNALARHGVNLTRVRVPWHEKGWRQVLREVARESAIWSGSWVVLQHTALSWSSRGFPFRILAIARILKNHGVKVAVVFHESAGCRSKGIVGWLRFACQEWTVHRLYKLADRAIFTVPIKQLKWVSNSDSKACFIAIGANIPQPAIVQRRVGFLKEKRRTVGIFCITEGAQGLREVGEISAAVRQARKGIPGLRLVVLGRGAMEASATLHRAFAGSNIELEILDVLPAEEVTRLLSGMDALLYVRGEVTPQRGTAIAAIACGVPLVAYGDSERAFPVSKGGVLLSPLGDVQSLGTALEKVLTDEQLWADLHARSLAAQQEYFSWDAIAARYAGILRND
ncbi:MAG: glycosyltransferase family protein [Candidatus Acidiferrales bacterium]